jgi:hypothetical protein
MYSVIDRFQQPIISAINPPYVAEYEWLLQNIGQATTARYQLVDSPAPDGTTEVVP